MRGRGDLAIHRWVLERSLASALKSRMRIEAARIRKLMAGIDRRLRLAA